MTSVQSSTRLPCGNRVLDLAQTHVMGILNVTPDSFSDGGRYNQLDEALRHAEAMVAAGFEQLPIAENYYDDLRARYGLDAATLTALAAMLPAA